MSLVFRLVYTREAKKQIQKLNQPLKNQIQQAVELIAEDPKVGKPLVGVLKGRFSYRCGNYRIIYRIYHQEITVLILTVDHRRDVYKKQRRQ